MSVVRHALQPTISDITADWILPPGMELLQTPINSHHAPITRGEPIIIYALLCDTARLNTTLASALLQGSDPAGSAATTAGSSNRQQRNNPFTEQSQKLPSQESSSEKMEGNNVAVAPSDVTLPRSEANGRATISSTGQPRTEGNNKMTKSKTEGSNMASSFGLTKSKAEGTNTAMPSSLTQPNQLSSPLKTARMNKEKDPPPPLKLLTQSRKCQSNDLLCACQDVYDDTQSANSDNNLTTNDMVNHRVQDVTLRRTRAVSMPDNTIASDPTSLQRLLNTLDAADRRQSESQLNGRRRHASTHQRHGDRSAHLNSFDFEPASPAWDDYMDDPEVAAELLDLDVQSLNSAVLLGQLGGSGSSSGLVDMSSRSGQGCVVVTGLFCGRPIRCEVPFDIGSLVSGEWRGPIDEDDAWEETIHQLASCSLLMDYDIQTMGLPPRDDAQAASEDNFQLRSKMVDLSQASHVICRHTAFVSLDLETLEPLPSPVVIMPSQPKATHNFQRRAARFWGYNAVGKQYSSSFTDSEDEGAFSSGYGLDGVPPGPVDSSRPPGSISKGPHSPWSSQGSAEYYAWSFEKPFAMNASSKPRAWQLGSRLNRLRSRLSNVPSKRPLFRAVDVAECCVGRTLSMECVELHALVNLQLACGAWELDYELAEAIDIPLEKLRRACLFCDVPVNYEAMIPISPLAGPRFRTLYTSSSQGSSSCLQTPDKDSSLDSPKWSPEGAVGVQIPVPPAPSPPDSGSIISDKSLSQSESGYVTVKSSSSPEDLHPPPSTVANGSARSSPNTLAVVNKRPESLASIRSPSPTPNGAAGMRAPLTIPKKMDSVTAANFSPSRRRRERFAAVQQLRKELKHMSPDESQQQRLWATALALVWLEHNCASFFNEWELLAAKADHWLSEQPIPKASGIDLAELKASARQLIVLSRKY